MLGAISIVTAIRRIGTAHLASANPNGLPKIALADEGPGILAIVDDQGNVIDFATGLTSHQRLAEDTSSLIAGAGNQLKPGFHAITITKEGGRPVAILSRTFHGNTLPAPQSVQDAIRQIFQ